MLSQCPGSFLGIIGRDPSRVSKPNQLHVVILRVLVLKNIRLIWGLFHKFGDFPAVLNFQPVISQTQPPVDL